MAATLPFPFWALRQSGYGLLPCHLVAVIVPEGMLRIALRTEEDKVVLGAALQGPSTP